MTKYCEKKTFSLHLIYLPFHVKSSVEHGQCYNISLLHMNRLNSTESAVLFSLMCSLIPEDLPSQFILQFSPYFRIRRSVPFQFVRTFRQLKYFSLCYYKDTPYIPFSHGFVPSHRFVFRVCRGLQLNCSFVFIKEA